MVVQGKKYQQYKPQHFKDIPSKKAMARIKRESDGITRVRRVKVLFLRGRRKLYRDSLKHLLFETKVYIHFVFLFLQQLKTKLMKCSRKT